MSGLRRLLIRLARAGPRLILRKLLRRTLAPVATLWGRTRDLIVPTYGHVQAGKDLNRLFPAAPTYAGDQRHLSMLVDLYLAHRFDLLGSGWTDGGYGVMRRGFGGHVYPPGPRHMTSDESWLDPLINKANRRQSRHVWRLVDLHYRPIDWQADIRSGYRWRSDIWYRDLAIAPAPGADVKLPWELSRGQHLPQLARAFALGIRREECQSEFRNVVLDFIATNPPRFGVNWTCAMDVAIRVVNWLVAYDLFRAAGADFDPEFRSILTVSVRDHARYIAGHLEWNDGIRGNHYLSDLVGLIACGCYLPADPETRTWCETGLSALIRETEVQFHDDGGNFEASTPYHRLSAELVVYGTAFALAHFRQEHGAEGDWQNMFGDAFRCKLRRAAEFMADMVRPDGRIVQFGDNDSGRLLKLFPVYSEVSAKEARERFANLAGYDSLADNAAYLVEDSLAVMHLVSAIGGLIGAEDLCELSGHPEGAMVAALAGKGIPADTPRWTAYGREITGSDVVAVPHNAIETWRIPLPGSSDAVRTAAYPDFGVYLFRSADLYLAIRCGPVGVFGLGPHAHNDQLSFELWVNGCAIAVDPGTYTYTPLPDERRRYRSAAAHTGPRLVGREPADLDAGIFALGPQATCECLEFRNGRFVGRYSTLRGHIYREVKVEGGAVLVTDWTTEPGIELETAYREPVPYSPAYGWVDSLVRPAALAHARGG